MNACSLSLLLNFLICFSLCFWGLQKASKWNRKERKEKIRFNSKLYMVPQACCNPNTLKLSQEDCHESYTNQITLETLSQSKLTKASFLLPFRCQESTWRSTSQTLEGGVCPPINPEAQAISLFQQCLAALPELTKINKELWGQAWLSPKPSHWGTMWSQHVKTTNADTWDPARESHHQDCPVPRYSKRQPLRHRETEGTLILVH